MAVSREDEAGETAPLCSPTSISILLAPRLDLELRLKTRGEPPLAATLPQQTTVCGKTPIGAFPPAPLPPWTNGPFPFRYAMCGSPFSPRKQISCEINVCTPAPLQKSDVVVASLTNCWAHNNLYIIAAEGTRRLYFL